MDTKERGMESSLIPRLLALESGRMGLLRRGAHGRSRRGQVVGGGIGGGEGKQFPERTDSSVSASSFLRNRIGGHVRGCC